MSASSVLLSLLAVLAGTVLWLALRLRSNTQALDVPSIFFVLPIPWRLLLPHVPLLNPLRRTDWTTRFARYKELRSSVVKTTHLTNGTSTLWLADKRAVKLVSIDRKNWVKPTELYDILAMFGRNLVTTEGPEWKAHRRIVGPSFTERVYASVFETTLSVVREMLSETGWGELEKGEEVEVRDWVKVVMRLALVVISREAFDLPMPWDEEIHPMEKVEGCRMSTSEAMGVVSEETLVRLLTPKWAYYLPIPLLKKVDLAFTELDRHMLSLLSSRRSSLEKGEEIKEDLFSSLVLNAASLEGEDGEGGEEGPGGAGGGERGLSDREILGNTFIFLLAGHETSGHTLSFVFALLALNPDEQEKLYKHVMSVWPDGKEPAYEDFPLLSRSLAVLYETSRLFPSVTVIPKKAARDTTLPYSAISGEGEVEEEKCVVVKRGTEVYIDTTGLHTNPQYWEDPLEFRPERFLASYDKDAFVPFSAGPRACVGKRFAEVSTVVIISLLVREFEFSARPRKGESERQMRERLVRATAKLTLTPKDMDLVLRKR